MWRASPPSHSQEEGAEEEEEGLDSGNQVSLLGDLLHVKGAEQHQQHEELQQGSHGAHVSLGDRVATPLHWLHCAWFTPFTSYPLASKLARLGLEEDELEGKGLEIREEQERGQLLLDDSRLGHELGGSLEDKSVEDESEPGNPVDGREEAEDVIF